MAMTSQPITRQTLEVALSAMFSSQSVMLMNATFIKMILLVRRSLRLDHRVTVSQKKNNALVRHRTPSIFFPVVGPVYIATPVHSLYCLPMAGKYLTSNTERGISR